MIVEQLGSLETAVVILCYNGRALLEELLPITLQHTAIDEQTKVVVVDNASTDDSVEWMKTNYPELPLICFNENHGFAGGYNLAIERIEAKFHVLLSTDVEVSANWLPPLIDRLRADESVGACQPKVRSYHRRNEFEYAGGAGGYLDRWGVPLCRGRIFGYSEEDHGQYNDLQEVFWASGCCFVVRATAWHAAGGLDTDFFAHMEEIDLCWRMQGKGYRILACPEATVYHMGGQTLSYNNPKKLYLNCRNNLIMLVKNWPMKSLWWRLPLRFVLDWIGAIYFLFKRGFPSFQAIFQGHWDFLTGLSKWNQKRKQTQRANHTVGGIYLGSIVFDHFVRGIKNFGNLRKDSFTKAQSS